MEIFHYGLAVLLNFYIFFKNSNDVEKLLPRDFIYTNTGWLGASSAFVWSLMKVDSATENYRPPSWFLILDIGDTQKFQILKQMLLFYCIVLDINK